MRKHYPLNSNGAEDAGKLPWIDGVPSTGVEGSYPGQALFVDTEAEILAAIDASGQTRNGSDLTQLIQAIARGIYVGQFAGTPNALTCALPNNVIFSSLLRGLRLGGFVTATNATVSGSAGVTVALAGIGPVTAPGTVTAPLLRKNGTALQAGDLPVNQDFEIRWDGSAFRMAGSVASDGGLTSVAPLASMYVTKTAAQTLPDSQYTDVTFGVPGTAPPFCTFDGVNMTGWTPGKYVFKWVIQFTNTLSGANYLNSVSTLWKNGAALTAYAGDGQQCWPLGGTFKNTDEFTTPILDVLSTDAFKMRSYSGSPASTSLQMPAGSDTWLNVIRLA